MMEIRTRHLRPRKTRALLASAALLCLFADAATADDRTIAGVVYDVAIERPIGLAETLVGVAVTGMAYPIALGAGKTDLVVERCINTPGRYTFTRGLGDFAERPQNQCSPVGFGFGLVKLSFGLIERPLGLLFGRSPFSRETPGPEGGVEVEGEVPSPPSRNDGTEV